MDADQYSRICCYLTNTIEWLSLCKTHVNISCQQCSENVFYIRDIHASLTELASLVEKQKQVTKHLSFSVKTSFETKNFASELSSFFQEKLQLLHSSLDELKHQPLSIGLMESILASLDPKTQDHSFLKLLNDKGLTLYDFVDDVALAAYAEHITGCITHIKQTEHNIRDFIHFVWECSRQVAQHSFVCGENSIRSLPFRFSEAENLSKLQLSENEIVASKCRQLILASESLLSQIKKSKGTASLNSLLKEAGIFLDSTVKEMHVLHSAGQRIMHVSEEVEKWVSEYSLRLGKFSSVYKELVKLTQIMKPGLMSLYSLQADLVFHKDQVESDIQQYDHLILRYEGFFEVYHRLILEIYRRRMEVAKIGNMISSFHEKITAVMKEENNIQNIFYTDYGYILPDKLSSLIRVSNIKFLGSIQLCLMFYFFQDPLPEIVLPDVKTMVDHLPKIENQQVSQSRH
eukprot:Sdes_comp20946_c0_seq6m18533